MYEYTYYIYIIYTCRKWWREKVREGCMYDDIEVEMTKTIMAKMMLNILTAGLMVVMVTEVLVTPIGGDDDADREEG